MTQDNKIWHTPDEKLPEDGCNVVVLGPMGYGAFVWETTEHRAGRYHYENWYKWAYLVDIIISLESSSKALDVAIGALQYYRDYEYDRKCSVATDAMKQVNEIMKGEE